MKNGLYGICVQIGLHTSAEYLWLSDPELPPPTVNCPPSIQETLNRIGRPRHHYIGIDCDPVSIARMWRDNADRIAAGDAEFLLAYIASRSGEPRAFAYNANYEPVIKGIDWWMAISVSFTDFMTRCAKRYGSVEFLAMDIEGTEVEIFLDYDFSVRPRLIDLEFHFPEHFDSVMKRFTDAGYALMHQAPHGHEDIQHLLLEDTRNPYANGI